MNDIELGIVNPDRVFHPVGVFDEPLMTVLVYATQYELMYSLGRIQEFYENPDLRNAVFTREQLQRCQPDYYIRWNGCNFPYDVVKDFLKLSEQFEPDEHEMAAINLIRPGCYVVGVHLGQGPEMANTLWHERMHAYFASNSIYRHKLQKLADAEEDITNTVYHALARLGYADNVWLDEYQAWAVNGPWGALGMERPDTQLVVHAREIGKALRTCRRATKGSE